MISNMLSFIELIEWIVPFTENSVPIGSVWLNLCLLPPIMCGMLRQCCVIHHIMTQISNDWLLGNSGEYRGTLPRLRLFRNDISNVSLIIIELPKDNWWRFTNNRNRMHAINYWNRLWMHLMKWIALCNDIILHVATLKKYNQITRQFSKKYKYFDKYIYWSVVQVSSFVHSFIHIVYLAMLRNPQDEVACSGVQPSLSPRLTSAPCVTRNSTMSKLSSMHAWNKHIEVLCKVFNEINIIKKLHYNYIYA